MIEVEIPKDPNRYEPKQVGPFTIRQTICVAIMGVSGYFIYQYVSPYLGTDLTGFLILIPAVIAWAFGWWKPYGLRFEAFIKTAFICNFISPTKRKYVTENHWETIMKMPLLEQIEDSKKKKKKKKPRKKKYKKSKLAIR